MKKLLIIGLLFLASCGYESQNNMKVNIVVETGTTVLEGGLCYYKCTGTSPSSVAHILASTRFVFYDSCGKYTVGDTVQITKW